MNPHYPLHPKRQRLSLDGVWDFKWLGSAVDIERLDPSDIRYDELMAVPGVFDTCCGYAGQRGVGVYRRRLHLDAWADTDVRLKVAGLGLYARLWWDARLVGENQLPYSSVDYDFAGGKPGNHDLVIAIDNRFNPERVPLFSPNYDFYGYGGIYRHLELQQLPERRVERVQVTTRDLATGTVDLSIRLGGAMPQDCALQIGFDQNPTTTHRAQPVDGVVSLTFKVPHHKVWSPASPNLHTVTVTLDGDCIVERFGLRTIATDGQQLLLNGKPIRLQGVNRHEAHPDDGPVQSSQLMMNDLRHMKNLGCNFMRCVHYPQDQRLLDLCDQTGMLVWQESLGWNDSETLASDPHFFELQVEQTRLMVRNSINHPAIILWGFLNEGCSDRESGKELYQALARTIKAEDPKLLVSYASNKIERDLCLEYADVMAMNIYPGWIGNADWNTPPVKLIRPRVDQLADYFSQRPDLADKPLMIAEIGACGLYGCHDQAHAQWSEEFQAAYVVEACRSILDNARYCGFSLWQLFDTRSYVNGGDVRCKPKGFNCAGLLNEYRQPKLAYQAVKHILAASPALHPTAREASILF